MAARTHPCRRCTSLSFLLLIGHPWRRSRRALDKKETLQSLSSNKRPPCGACSLVLCIPVVSMHDRFTYYSYSNFRSCRGDEKSWVARFAHLETRQPGGESHCALGAGGEPTKLPRRLNAHEKTEPRYEKAGVLRYLHGLLLLFSYILSSFSKQELVLQKKIPFIFFNDICSLIFSLLYVFKLSSSGYR